MKTAALILVIKTAAGLWYLFLAAKYQLPQLRFFLFPV